MLRGLTATLLLLIVIQSNSLRAFGQSLQTNGATEGITQDVLKERILKRVDALAGLLDREAGQRQGLSDVLSRSRASLSVSILSDLRLHSSNIPELAPLGRATSPTAEVQNTASHIKSTAEELSNAAEATKSLRDRIAAAPPEQAIALLDKFSLPSSITGIVFDPLGTRLNEGRTQPKIVSTRSFTPFIVGSGNSSVDFPAVGAVLYRNSQSDLMTGCTGTLIGSTAVLTAAHCLNVTGSDSKPHKPLYVFFQHEGLIRVSTAIPPTPFPSYSGTEFGDIGIIFLEKAVIGIDPVKLNTFAQVPSASIARIVGFGYHNLFNVSTPTSKFIDSSGIKVWAHVQTEKCTSKKSLICWTYKQRPVDSVFGSTCYGDSGGPLFSEVAGEWVLSGITHGGSSDKPCLPGDKAVDAEVFDFRWWIIQQLQSHITPVATMSLQPLLPLDNDADSRYVVQISDSIFQPADPTFSKMFSLNAQQALVRISVNATPRRTGVSTGLSLAVERGGQLTECHNEVDDTATSCDLPPPAGGDWKVIVSGAPGQEFQVVATLFSKLNSKP